MKEAQVCGLQLIVGMFRTVFAQTAPRQTFQNWHQHLWGTTAREIFDNQSCYNCLGNAILTLHHPHPLGRLEKGGGLLQADHMSKF